MAQTLTQQAKPFIKWVGGKGRLLEQIKPHLPQSYNRYHEPFLGGGALFFHLQPDRAILSDINPDLINVYKCVRDRVDILTRLLDAHKLAHSEHYYYAMRSNEPTDPIERAARFIYLNKTCFNGLYRQNKQGKFNVPMGKYKNPAVCDRETLIAASQVLQGVKLRVQSFDEVLITAGAGDLVYFDPPYYPVSKTSSFTGYTKHDFSAQDQERLRDVAIALVEGGVHILLSNSDCPFIRDLYCGFDIREIQAPRSINSKGDKRSAVGEVLISSIQ